MADRGKNFDIRENVFIAPQEGQDAEFGIDIVTGSLTMRRMLVLPIDEAIARGFITSDGTYTLNTLQKEGN